MVAKKTKSKTRKTSKMRMGRIMSPVDVRSADKIGAFEGMLGSGPITLVLVYADWCGHCQRFKKDTWNDLTAMSNRKMNIAAVRDDMLPKTSLANSKIKGYPSLMLVGTDKRPAEFSEDGEVTNAMPSNEKKNLQSLLQTPLPEMNESMATPVKTGSPMIDASAVNSTPPSPMANLTGTLKPPSPTLAANASQDEIDEAMVNQPISAPPDNDMELVESATVTPSNRAKAPIGGGNLLTSLIRLVKTSSKAFMKKRATRRKVRKAKGKGTKGTRGGK
jgi:thiol-disulfide isomerase/thioredoxin